MTDYIYYSPNEIFDMIYKLGDKIKGSFNPDCLIGMSRGGLWVVRVLSDYFNNPNVFIIMTKYYKGIESTKRKLEILQDLDEKIVAGKKVLIVDDVADTGVSMSKGLELIKNKGAAKAKTATLHYKPWSIIKPDYFVEQTEKWIVYPWEINETIKSIIKTTTKEKLSQELKRTGIPKKLFQKFL